MSAPSRRPFVLVNMAMTSDGKIATANRRVTSFGSPTDHAHLLELRSTVDAVMSGARTVDGEKITMGPGPARYRRLRMRHGLAEYNLRVIVSGSGTLDPNAEVFRHRFSPIIVLTTQRAGLRRMARLRAVADDVKAFGDTTLRLDRALQWLSSGWGVRRLLCEGGGELNFAMLRAGLVDELHITVCPGIFGGRDAPTVADGQGFGSLASAASLRLVSARRRRDEMFLVYTVESPRDP